MTDKEKITALIDALKQAILWIELFDDKDAPHVVAQVEAWNKVISRAEGEIK